MSGKEHKFQGWVDRFIDRVVLPPMFTSGIDHAGTDMHKIQRRAALAGRGVKFGIPDVFVAQSGKTAWLELKRGSSVSGSQEAIHRAMTAAGQHVSICSTIAEVLAALRDAGMTLHQNADALAAEYELRVLAKEAAPWLPKKPSKARAPAVSAARIRRVAKIRSEVLF